jgi:hypothetical protein
VSPGYAASGQAFRNIAEAGVSGAEMGGGGALSVKVLGAVLSRVMTGAWGTAARDAANGVMSEANILDTNVLPGAAGEAAHNGALGKAIGDVLKGDPVDVSSSIPPDSNFGRAIGDIPMGRRDPDLTTDERGRTIDAATGEQVYFQGVRNPISAEDKVGESPWWTWSEDNARSYAGDGGYVRMTRDSDLDPVGLVRSGSPEFTVEGMPEFTIRPDRAAATAAEPAAEAVRPGSLTPDQIREQLAAPETANAARADLERAIDEAAKSGKALQVPIGFDFERGPDGYPIMSGMFGNQVTMTPIFGRVADQLAEVDKMNELAAQIAACATPGAMQEAAE